MNENYYIAVRAVLIIFGICTAAILITRITESEDYRHCLNKAGNVADCKDMQP